MSITATNGRARKPRYLNGVPMVRTSFIDEPPPEALRSVPAWWAWLCAAALAAATGCGAGSAEPSYQVQGAIRAYTSGGPVDVIVVRRSPAVQQ